MTSPIITKTERTKTAEAVRKAKELIPPYNGVSISGKNFVTGKITVLRRSLQDIFEHAIEYKRVNLWLQSFELIKLKAMKYRGWASNRPYPINHPKYDPDQPLKSKHSTDTDYFLYYTIKIDRWECWVNVKMHKHFGEVVYTIEESKPNDLIKGHKKKVTLKTSIPPQGWRD